VRGNGTPVYWTTRGYVDCDSGTARAVACSTSDWSSCHHPSPFWWWFCLKWKKSIIKSTPTTRDCYYARRWRRVPLTKLQQSLVGLCLISTIKRIFLRKFILYYLHRIIRHIVVIRRHLQELKVGRKKWLSRKLQRLRGELRDKCTQ